MITIPNTFFISDTHFNHNKEFIYKPRGFSSVEEMNERIIENWNKTVNPEDLVYHLGDMYLGEDFWKAEKLIKRLNGHIYLIIGNHDTENKIGNLSLLENIDCIHFGARLKVSKRTTFLLSHYAMLTGNYDESHTYSIHGHTHSLNKFSEGYPLMYNVSCEAINCTPIAFEEVISDLRKHKEDFF